MSDLTLSRFPVSAAAAAGLLLPTPAFAHSFGKLYTLPVPVWMYLYGAAAALVVSFLIIGYFVTTPQDVRRNVRTRALPTRLNVLVSTPVLRVLQGVSFGLLALSIVSGFAGTRHPYENFNMTFFWIVVVLGYAYAVALLGNSYAVMHPWHLPMKVMARQRPSLWQGRRAYPAHWGYAPALALYVAFIWIELFGATRPLSLSFMLLGYTVITLLGCFWWGREAWFRYGDFFAVFFRITAKMAPIAFIDGRFRLRQPFVGLLEERCERITLLLFILFMLSSTAFDGLHETVPWLRLYWQDGIRLLQPLIGDNVVQTFPILKMLFLVYQTVALVLSPLAYLAIYVLLVALAKWLTRAPQSIRELCLEFGYSLVPIAFVYHLTHYYTLAVSQGLMVFKLLSDPFGFGWNLFGTAGWFANPVLLDAGTVWHTQVALILLGHIVSVYLAHVVALRIFPTTRAAVVSQLPMLLLMVLYTTAGLWILSQPMQAGLYLAEE